MTVKEKVLNAIIKDYPRVKNIKIERAHPKHPMSGSRILRRLKEEGVSYEFKYTMSKGKKTIPYQHYDFSATPKSYIISLL